MIEAPQTKPEVRFNGPAARPDGTLPSAVELVRDLNEVFSTGEEGELSFVRGMLRCMGHLAVGTPEDQLTEDADIPPVNPWKLISAASKAVVNKSHRREMMTRIKEGMSLGDSIGLLAVLSIYDAGKHSGMTQEQARANAWDFYRASAPKQ
jgi:hypothetical protein